METATTAPATERRRPTHRECRRALGLAAIRLADFLGRAVNVEPEARQDLQRHDNEALRALLVARAERHLPQSAFFEREEALTDWLSAHPAELLFATDAILEAIAYSW